jgi:hypothetical protein
MNTLRTVSKRLYLEAVAVVATVVAEAMLAEIQRHAAK